MNRFKKILLVVANLSNSRCFANKFVYSVLTRAVTIHSCHDPIRFDSVRSRSDRFDEQNDNEQNNDEQGT